MSEVDAYIENSDKWSQEISALRPVLLGCGLTEQIKWAKPCYSHHGRNIVIIQEMKDFLSLMFFKGGLLSDPDGILEDQGPNSRSARRIRFSSTDDVTRLAEGVTAYIEEAIAIEESGQKVEPPHPLAPVEALAARLDRDPEFKAAFETLTPGRQREYNLYFSNAKQASTRESRVERCVEKILEGRGLRE